MVYSTGISIDAPFFLKDETWFTEEFHDDGSATFHLTDAAPEEARRSYEEYYGERAYTDDDGNSIVPDGWSVY